MSDEQTARELAQLDADVAAVLAVVEGGGPTGQAAEMLGEVAPDMR